MSLGIWYHGVNTEHKFNFVLKHGLKPTKEGKHAHLSDKGYSLWFTRQIDLIGYSDYALFKVNLSGLENHVLWTNGHTLELDCSVGRNRIVGVLKIPPKPSNENQDLWVLKHVRDPNMVFESYKF